MCGIAGIVEKRGSVSPEALNRMVQSMHHRGPDQKDIFLSEDGKIGLGAARLKIIDLSERAAMPMKVNGNVIVMNGEVYNFKMLRRYLERKGEKFFSSSDTEVAGRLFLHEREKSLNLLRGMFTIAIYDREKNDVFLARDRLGIKPLYIYRDDERVIFASEVRAILASGLVNPELDMRGVAGFFLFGSSKYPYTPVKKISEFPSGHYTWICSGDEIRYWETTLNNELNHLSDDEIAENLRNLIEESVRLRLVSDVPLGCFLSGGLDSTIVSSIAKKYKGELNTFSIRFEEEEFDEGNYSQMASEFIGTEHREMVVTHNDVLNNLEKIIKGMDLPSVDGVNTYFVSRFTRENGIVVSLSGLGGDELFGGYSSFKYVPQLIKMKKSPFLRTGIKVLSGWLNNRKFVRAGEFMNSPGGIEEAYFSIRGILNQREMESLLGLERGFFNPSVYLASMNNDSKGSILNRIAFLELTSYMRDMLLRDTDSMSMAHSLEVRVPFIDHRVVEFVLRLPSRFRTEKRFLYRAFKHLLPEWMAKRKKRGFIFPFEKWIKENKINVRDVIMEHRLFNEDVVGKLYSEFLRGRIDWHPIWAMYVFSMWIEEAGLKVG